MANDVLGVSAGAWRVLRDEGAEQARDGGGGEGETEEDDGRVPDVATASQLDAVVGDGEGDGGGEERRDPRDVLLPLHPERVPLRRLLLSQQEVARVVGELRRIGPVDARGRRRPIPGVRDERPGYDREPGDDRHDPCPGEEAGPPLPDSLDRQEALTQAPETGKPAAECEQKQRPENEPVQDGVELAVSEFHLGPFVRGRTLRPHLDRCSPEALPSLRGREARRDGPLVPLVAHNSRTVTAGRARAR